MALAFIEATMFLAFLLFSLFVSEQKSAVEINEWSDSNVVVFGDVVLDFELEKASIGDGFTHRSQLSKCSNEKFLCLKAGFGGLLVPRKCERNINIGEVWTHGGITTRVVGKVQAPMGHLAVPGDWFVLQTDGFPRIAYLYEVGRGVQELLVNRTGDLDLSWARQKGSPSAALQTPEVLKLRHPLRTFRSFGGCRA